MLARVVRNGLVEATHDGAVAAVSADRAVQAWTGDRERQFYLRSAAKPFQATVSQEHGARLSSQQMALACASHGGRPVHVAIVHHMLAEVGLGEEALRCPPAWPFGEGAKEQLVASGQQEPRPIWHNCSGKHAAMLRACVASGWPIDEYQHPDHPLQQRITAAMEEVLGSDPGPVGIDGCGVPAFRATVVAMASAYARLATDRRFEETWTSMHRYPALTSDLGQPATRLATWLDAAAKHGAEACLGIAIRRRMGVAVKIWDGAPRAVGVAMVEALRQLELLPGVTGGYLADVAEPPVLGGGTPQGSIEPTLRLTT